MVNYNATPVTFSYNNIFNLAELSKVMLATFVNTKQKEILKKIIKAIITHMTYTLRTFKSKRKSILCSHLRNKRKPNNSSPR